VPGPNGQSSTEPSSAGDSPAEVPGLTVAQRLLLKLPDIGRNKQRTAAPETVDPPVKSPQKPVRRPPATSSAPPTKASTAKSSTVETGAVESTTDETGTADESGDQDEREHVVDAEVIDKDAGSSSGGGSSSTSRSSSSRSSSSRSQKPPPGSVYDQMPTSQLTVLMRKLDDKERMLAFGAAPLGAVLAIVVAIVALHSNPALHHKGHETPSLIVSDGGVAVGFAILVFATAWFRRRSLTAFALLFLGYSIGLIGPGIPFLFLGGYFLYRAWKVQKVLTGRGVSTRPPPKNRNSNRATRDPKGGRDRETKTTVVRPTANKRYTPPRPPPKRPPIPKPEKTAGS
jgi:hypothetical protein